MTDIDRLRRAGGGVLRLLVDLIPVDLPTERHTKDEEVEMCLVFADVADYSDFVADAGDDAAIAILDVLDEIVEQVVDEHPDPRVVKRLGDGLMIATENPDEAVRIAVCLVEEFSHRTAELGAPLQLRAGVHRGTCRTRGGDVFGYHVNLAARVAASARPGRAIATAHALAGVDLDEHCLLAKPAGKLRAKGVNNPVALFRVAREADAGRCGEIDGVGGARLWPRVRMLRLGDRRSRVG
jgi:adenylate cyclase